MKVKISFGVPNKTQREEGISTDGRGTHSFDRGLKRVNQGDVYGLEGIVLRRGGE